jgi:hypothetical protein
MVLFSFKGFREGMFKSAVSRHLWMMTTECHSARQNSCFASFFFSSGTPPSRFIVFYASIGRKLENRTNTVGNKKETF